MTEQFVLEIPGGAAAPSRARGHVSELIAKQLDDAACHRALVLVSEIVTNTVVHAGVGPAEKLRIDVLIDARRLRIAVTDHGAAAGPQMREPNLDEPGGIGLFLVDQMSDGWGVEADPGRRTEVWFEMCLG